MDSKEKYWYFHLDIFPGCVPFVYLSSVMVDFKLKMMSLDDTSGRPKSQTDDQFTTSSPHCNCPEDTAKAHASDKASYEKDQQNELPSQ